MKRFALSLLLFVALMTAAFIGGIVGSWFFGGHAALAQGSQSNITADSVTTSVLNVVDSEGKLRAEVSVLDDGTAGVWLYGPDQDLRAFLGAGTDGTPNLFLYDAGSEGSVRASLGLSGDGPGLILYDSGSDGKQRAALTLMSDGSAVLGLSDTQGQATLGGLMGADGKAALVITDKDGNILWGAPPSS
jgi:hypothetical protein